MQTTYTAALYDKRLQTQTFEWMVKFNEHLTHACTFNFWQFNSELTAEQAWQQWECYCKYLNRVVYGKAAKRHNKTLLILPVLHGEESSKNLHIHATIGCIDKDYNFKELKVIIDTAWREMKWALRCGEITEYRDSNWLSYKLRNSTRLDLSSVDLTRCFVPAALLKA